MITDVGITNPVITESRELATGKITKRSADALRPGERDKLLWDTDAPGFGLKVTPRGTRTYLVQYRLGGRKGRTRRVTIGRHGRPWSDSLSGETKSLTPDVARMEAKRLLGLVAAGKDPAEDKTILRRAPTVADLCDLYLVDGIDEKKASTVAMDRIRITRHVLPNMGSIRARDVTQKNVRDLLKKVAKRSGKGAAARTVGMLGGIFTFAVENKICLKNPVRGVRRYEDRKVGRFLSNAEISRLGESLSAAEQEGVNLYAIAAIRLLIFTGCRKAEILTMRWEFVDWEHDCIRLPDSKTGAKIVALGTPAIDLLKEIPRIEGNPFVIAGAKKDAHLVGLQKIWDAIRADADIPDVRLHDLRHSFASVAAAQGESLLLIGKLLGHKKASSTQRYAHLGDDPLRSAVNRVSSQIESALCQGRPNKVIALKRA